MSHECQIFVITLRYTIGEIKKERDVEMKKILFGILLIGLVTLAGCSEKANFIIPDSNVTLSKNVILGDLHEGDLVYYSIILEDNGSISALIEDLNKIRYRTENLVKLEIIGYMYKIEFDNTVISVVNNKYFYLNGQLCKVTSSDFEFLDEYSWELIVEA